MTEPGGQRRTLEPRLRGLERLEAIRAFDAPHCRAADGHDDVLIDQFTPDGEFVGLDAVGAMASSSAASAPSPTTDRAPSGATSSTSRSPWRSARRHEGL